MRLGLLTIASVSYLISISRREQVAQIRGSPIYTITGVTLIPLSSQQDGTNAIVQAKESLKKEAGGQASPATDDSDTSDNEEVPTEDGHTEDDEPQPVVTASPTDQDSTPLPADKGVNTSVAEDVIGRKGQYGRFAERWFRKRGWSTEKKRAQGMSTATIGDSPVDGRIVDTEKSDQTSSYTSAITQGVSGWLGSRKETAEQPFDKNQIEASNTHNVAATLLPKLLRTTRILFGSRSFFFSYEYDITRRLGSQENRNPKIPMHKIVDSLVSSPFHLEHSH